MSLPDADLASVFLTSWGASPALVKNPSGIFLTTFLLVVLIFSADHFQRGTALGSSPLSPLLSTLRPGASHETGSGMAADEDGPPFLESPAGPPPTTLRHQAAPRPCSRPLPARPGGA